MQSAKTVEVLAHPGIADELRVLRSESWQRLVAELGSFGELP
jgi:hypothetical protein